MTAERNVSLATVTREALEEKAQAYSSPTLRDEAVMAMRHTKKLIAIDTDSEGCVHSDGPAVGREASVRLTASGAP